MKLKYIFIYSLLLSSLFSCSDFLDRAPHTSLSPENFWNTEADLRLSLNNLYTRINRSYSLDNMSVDCFAATANHVSSGTLTPGNTDGTWSGAYRGIRIANDFFENYQKAQVSDEVKARYAGEAYFFKSSLYFNLIKRFGDVPYVEKTLDMTSPELMGPRVDKKVVLKHIIDDLTTAISSLPAKSEMKNDIGRITKGAAQTLLARVTLYYGTYFKSRSEQGYEEYLRIAKQVSADVIDSKEYSLYANYRDLFLYPGEDSEEHILSYRYSDEANTYNGRIRSTIADFRQEPTKYLADAFLCKDGLPLDKSAYAVEYLPLGKEFDNRDPRMALTIWKPGDSFRGEAFVPNLSNQTRTGYMFKKYGDEDSFTNQKSTINEILMRYAEVLLIYAEASYELAGNITDEELDKSINTLRGRFDASPNRLPNLTNAFVTANGLDMREEIRRERRVELCAESFRYDDLIRWKTAETELPVAILGAKFDSSVYTDLEPGKDINLDENGFILVQSASSRSFDVDRDYIFPLPLKELSLNGDLIQNPNW